MFGRIVKAVVDVEKQIMAVDAEMHAEQEEFLLEQGSDQNNLWGINLCLFATEKENFVEFDSMINLRPSCGNKSISVDPIIRKKIIEIVANMVKR